MTREQATKELKIQFVGEYDRQREAKDIAIKSLQAWDKFKQALDKRILEQGFDEDEWSISYNELIKMMKECGGVEC